MLFDVSRFRTPLPPWVRVFASGANRAAEIRGFARLGIPVGVAVNCLNQSAIDLLIEQQRPVMVDSGAFSEMAFTSEGPKVVSLITDAEWRRRLAVYLQLATSLREMTTVVAPDQVGSQQETLRRLARYRKELATIADTGARILLPLQVGRLAHADFLRAAEASAGIPLVPAMPMRKAVTTSAALIDFVREVKPAHLHLLGMGIDHPRAPQLLRAIGHFSPGTSLTMDSNRIRAVTGHSRAMTKLEEKLRTAETENIYGAVGSAVLDLSGDQLDYTDLIASPSLWCTPEQLRNLSNSAGLDAVEIQALLRDPDSFLQEPFRDSDTLAWIEHPLMSLALDRAWEQYVDTTIRSSVRTAAIVRVFRGSAIRDQPD